MDTLDTMDDSFESGSPQGVNITPEKAREKSEKQKESYSKALSGIGRSRKDE